MKKEKQSTILSFTITLNANEKGRVAIVLPANKTLTIHYIIFDNTAGNFQVSNDKIKHWTEDPFTLYGSTLNQELRLNPHGIIKQSGAGLKVQNIGVAQDTLNFTIVGHTE